MQIMSVKAYKCKYDILGHWGAQRPNGWGLVRASRHTPESFRGRQQCEVVQRCVSTFCA